MTDTPVAIPAATLALFRETASGSPELLFVERAGGMAFAAGALVFPGGRVDPDDRVIGAGFAALDPDDAAARVAAIRETIEESGLAIGLTPMPDERTTAALRAALATGEMFSTILARAGLTIDVMLLVPWARWCPSFRETRNFDTRFYIARLPLGTHAASVDETENVHLFWASAADVIARADRGEAIIIFPTRRNLERLSQYGSFDAAVAHAADIPVTLIQPWIEDRAGTPHICIPDGLGYPVTAEVLGSARRG